MAAAAARRAYVTTSPCASARSARSSSLSLSSSAIPLLDGLSFLTDASNGWGKLGPSAGGYKAHRGSFASGFGVEIGVSLFCWHELASPLLTDVDGMILEGSTEEDFKEQKDEEASICVALPYVWPPLGSSVVVVVPSSFIAASDGDEEEMRGKFGWYARIEVLSRKVVAQLPVLLGSVDKRVAGPAELAGR